MAATVPFVGSRDPAVEFWRSLRADLPREQRRFPTRRLPDRATMLASPDHGRHGKHCRICGRWARRGGHLQRGMHLSCIKLADRHNLWGTLVREAGLPPGFVRCEICFELMTRLELSEWDSMYHDACSFNAR